ncbi:hypothetical protein KGV52_01065 [Candidatus Gracilibacteria bacterium]|nr:hypothetical protein [Candidatus Gracilibacteria bacterium]
MITLLQNKFGLKNQKIQKYITPILEEHKEAISSFEKTSYRLVDVYLKETLRFGYVVIPLNNEEEFEKYMQKSGIEFVLIFEYQHKDFEKFEGPGSIVLLTLSHNSFSGIL